MSTQMVLNSQGQPVESFTATDAKNSFGAVLDQALSKGMVLITKRRVARAVLLSVEEYQALLARMPDPLQTLGAEFESLVADMHTPKARAAGKALFKARGTDLGKAAVAGARKRG